MKRIQSWRMFGPWISFKAVDLFERCASWPVEIPDNIVLMYDEPRAGLKLLAEDGRSEEQHFESLCHFFADYKAPPTGNRCCGPAEIETVLCKYKSYRGGHYYIGKDIYEQRKALTGWGKTASTILELIQRKLNVLSSMP